MRAKLIFDLGDHEDRREHLRCINATTLCSILWEMDSWLREKVKYSNEPEEKIEAFEQARNQLHELLNESSINLDNLYA